MPTIFTKIISVTFPAKVDCDPSTRTNKDFDVVITADGIIPFPQLIFRMDGREIFVNNEMIMSEKEYDYRAQIPAGTLTNGIWQLQAEGCRRSDITTASGEEWIKWFGEITLVFANDENRTPTVLSTYSQVTNGVKLYFGIHKHMHQPYYRSADVSYWDGQMDDIFGNRYGPYSHFIPGAVEQYIAGNLPHAGLSTSWSGSLIEQLERCEQNNRCGGRFINWKLKLRELSKEKTALGHPRIEFSAFGHFHPLMALIPQRDISKQIQWHRTAIIASFDSRPSPTLFPPETAFHSRMIPALIESGINAVIYDSIHLFRACKEYPYAGMTEGMLPPSPCDQENPSPTDWLQLQNIWAASKIAPSLLKPAYVRYEAPDGSFYKIIGIPAERYIGNEDARGGFGALQYGSVLGQVYDSIVKNNSFDPLHPPFFILHSDGDNHGGGADSYYYHNTGNMVKWLKNDSRFELTTIEDYLERFPVDEGQTIHLEPGSWSGADNGDPQFRKWFSRYDEPYSPDLNSWAVLTAFQNCIHTLEDNHISGRSIDQAIRLLLTAETSCYWYWTGQDIWDSQVTSAANTAYSIVKNDIDRIMATGKDTTGPTIFPAWITPENPGGQTWGNNGLRTADKTGTVHTFIADISGIRMVSLILRIQGHESEIPMQPRGCYPSHTGAFRTAEYFTCQLPAGKGDIRYYIVAVDKKGNKSVGSLERAFLA